MRNRRAVGLAAAMAAILIAGLLLQAPSKIGCQGFEQRMTVIGLDTEAATATAPGVGRFDDGHVRVTQTAIYSLVTVGPTPIRYRLDGTTPTQTVGHFANAHTDLEVCGSAAIQNFRFLAIGSAGGEAHVQATHYQAQ